MTYQQTPVSDAARLRSGTFDWLFSRRLVALFIAVSCGSVLAVAAWLTPSSTGMGTHTQLGLPPCSWITTMNIPCPTCGYTTAFSNAAHGRFLAAFDAQPFGALLAFATAIFMVGSLIVVCTGAPLGGVLCRFWTYRVTWVVLSMMFLGWVYTMLRFRGIL